MASIPSYKETVIGRFSGQAHVYEQHARLQELVAARLAHYLPQLEQPQILEVGCGTGFLTRHLLAAYSDGEFLITDLSQNMLDECADNSGVFERLQYSVMDGEHPCVDKKFDLIITSMTAQWFDTPLESLLRLIRLLKPGGHLLYSTIGPDLFPQWRDVLRDLGLPCGLLVIPDLPGVFAEDCPCSQFESGLAFLTSLKLTGASHPRSDYAQLSAGELRRALRLFETRMNCRCNWHILYGHLRG